MVCWGRNIVGSLGASRVIWSYSFMLAWVDRQPVRIVTASGTEIQTFRGGIMDSANRNISKFVYKSMSSECNLNWFPFCCDLLVGLIRVASVEANSVLTAISHPLVTTTDRIPYAEYNSRWYNQIDPYSLSPTWTFLLTIQMKSSGTHQPVMGEKIQIFLFGCFTFLQTDCQVTEVELTSDFIFNPKSPGSLGLGKLYLVVTISDAQLLPICRTAPRWFSDSHSSQGIRILTERYFILKGGL